MSFKIHPDLLDKKTQCECPGPMSPSLLTKSPRLFSSVLSICCETSVQQEVADKDVEPLLTGQDVANEVLISSSHRVNISEVVEGGCELL